MENWFSQPERKNTRETANAASDSTNSSDPYSFHQGDRSTPPNWDPYGYHQGDKQVTPVPKPMEPVNPVLPRPDVPLPVLPEVHKPHQMKLQDGALIGTDEQGRVILTYAADGSKTREVRYGDAADPAKVTQVIIDHNRSYSRNSDGRSWAYQVNGQASGTWYGDVHMSPKGEYSFEDYTTGAHRRFAPNTTEIIDSSQVQPRPVQDGGCNTYYPAPVHRPGHHNNRPMGGRFYNPSSYSDSSCSSQAYSSCNPYYGGNPGVQFGAQVLAGMAGYGMQRYAGYPGYYPAYYGGGNVANAVGQVIGRAILGHHRRY